MADDVPLWMPTPDRIAGAPITAFMAEASARAGTAFSSYAELHSWSIERREDFWNLVWDFCGVVGDKGERLLVDGDKIPHDVTVQVLTQSRRDLIERSFESLAGVHRAIVHARSDVVDR